VKKSLKTASDETKIINNILLSEQNRNISSQMKNNVWLKRGLHKVSTSKGGKENRFFNIFNQSSFCSEKIRQNPADI